MTKKRKSKYIKLLEYIKDLMDIDYINKLPPKERKYICRFIEEYYLNFFRNDGKGLHDNAKIARKQLYDAYNARKRDLLNRGERYDTTSEQDLEHCIMHQNNNYNEYETALINFLDKLFKK